MTAAKAYRAPVVYREMHHSDEDFVYSSWLRSMADPSCGSPLLEFVSSKIFFAGHKRVIARILDGAGVVIACNPEEPSQIFGYGVYQPTTAKVAVIHYIYVKHPYRRLGIGSELFRTMLGLADHDQELPAVATHMTGSWEALKDKWNLVFNPYLIGAHE